MEKNEIDFIGPQKKRDSPRKFKFEEYIIVQA